MYKYNLQNPLWINDPKKARDNLEKELREDLSKISSPYIIDKGAEFRRVHINSALDELKKPAWEMNPGLAKENLERHFREIFIRQVEQQKYYGLQHIPIKVLREFCEDILGYFSIV